LSTTPRSRQTTPRASPSVPPTAHELLAAPDLAILGALDQLLELVNFTLVALHPELAGEPSLLHPRDPQAALAEAITEHSARLASAMIRYRAAVLAALHRPDTGDDLPF
jgi:hypothetical protein